MEHPLTKRAQTVRVNAFAPQLSVENLVRRAPFVKNLEEITTGEVNKAVDSRFDAPLTMTAVIMAQRTCGVTSMTRNKTCKNV